MKPPISPTFGRLGLALAIVGTVTVYVGDLLALRGSPPILWMMAGGALYLPGAFLAALAFGYRKGGPIFRILFVVRGFFALGVVWGIMASFPPRPSL